MLELAETFTNNLLPIIVISGIGFLLGRFLSVDPRTLGRIIFYALSPALVFRLLTTSQLPLESIGLMMAFSTTIFLTCGLLAWIAGHALRLERTVRMAVVLTSMLTNSGNYGLPVVAFAFGDQALAYASVYFVTSYLLTNTLGVFVASLGKLNIKQALLGLLKVPAVYAIPTALLFAYTGWQLPLPLERSLTFLSDAAIPSMLILLGLELQRTQWSKQFRALSISSTIRLIISPLLALGLMTVFGFGGAPRQAGVTEAGMPSAVLSTVLASEYELEPSLVTATVFISTILSPLTLTPLLVFMGS